VSCLQTTIKECTNDNEDDTVFANFMEESGGKYIEVSYAERENLKKFLEEKLIQFNTDNKSKAMNIVLF
jgi:dynein heavy chain